MMMKETPLLRTKVRHCALFVMFFGILHVVSTIYFLNPELATPPMPTTNAGGGDGYGCAHPVDNVGQSLLSPTKKTATDYNSHTSTIHEEKSGQRVQQISSKRTTVRDANIGRNQNKSHHHGEKPHDAQMRLNGRTGFLPQRQQIDMTLLLQRLEAGAVDHISYDAVRTVLEDQPQQLNAARLPPSKPSDASVSLLDAAYWNQLPKIYPGRWNSPSLHNADTLTTYLVTEWTSQSSSSLPRNGTSTRWKEAEWPFRARALVYVPILKNAHTTIAMAMQSLHHSLPNSTFHCRERRLRSNTNGKGQLDSNNNVNIRQQRLNREFDAGLRSLEIPTTTTTTTTTSSSLSMTTKPALVFTVLRDPVDRYISGICQELRGASPSSDIRRSCFPPRPITAHNNTKLFHGYLECLLSILVHTLVDSNPTDASPFLPHIRPQTVLLSETLSQHPSVGVSVMGWSDLPRLLQELDGIDNNPDGGGGGAPAASASAWNYHHHQRDRHNPQYYTHQGANYYLRHRNRNNNFTTANDNKSSLRFPMMRSRSMPSKHRQLVGSVSGNVNSVHAMKEWRASHLQQARNQQQAKWLRQNAMEEEQLEQISVFCSTISTDWLQPIHIQVLCRIYQQDVALMRAIGMSTPLCG